MEYLWFALFASILAASTILTVLSLPGTWMAAGLALLWAWLDPSGDLAWRTALLCLGLALAAEIGEWVSQSMAARRFGATGRGNWGGILGAIAGGILGAPLFLGFGAILGGLAGAFAGALLVELLFGRPMDEALRAAKGSFFGKSLGTALKLSVQGAILFLCLPPAWPS